MNSSQPVIASGAARHEAILYLSVTARGLLRWEEHPPRNDECM